MPLDFVSTCVKSRTTPDLLLKEGEFHIYICVFLFYFFTNGLTSHLIELYGNKDFLFLAAIHALPG